MKRGPKPGMKARLRLAREMVSGRVAGSAGRFTPGVPKCPGWLSAEAKKTFRRVAKEMAEAGAVATVDVDLLTSYATVCADIAAVEKAIRAGGQTVSMPVLDRHGVPVPGRFVMKPNPLLKTRDGLIARQLQLAAALGIGPAARSRQTSATTAATPPAGNKVMALRDRIQAARAAFPAGGATG